MSELPAELHGVEKRFGAATALAGVSFGAERGEVVALLGPNGAGKTTAISILLGLRRPDAGCATLFGRDPRLPHSRRRVGVTPQESAFPPTLSVAEVIELVRAHYPQPASTRDVVEPFLLRGLSERRTGGLSGGERRRLAVALAFAGAPDLVVLDEPTAGLDLQARRACWDAVRSYRVAGGTVVMTTHHLDEAEALATRVVVLDRGHVVGVGSVDEIARRVGTTELHFRAPVLPDLPGVVACARNGEAWLVSCEDGDAAVRALVVSAVPFEALEVRRARLEDAVLSLTGGAR